jgi:dATP pyrophosphohydrolase
VARAPFQILVFPYRRIGDKFEFALFKRADDGDWQGIAGGGEDRETPLQAAIREAQEESGISPVATFVRLDTVSSVPVTCFRDNHLWGEKVYVIPEHAFGVHADGQEIRLSPEHSTFAWFSFAEAKQKLRYDSNRTALWELNQRLLGLGPRDRKCRPSIHRSDRGLAPASLTSTVRLLRTQSPLASQE